MFFQAHKESSTKASMAILVKAVVVSSATEKVKTTGAVQLAIFVLVEVMCMV